jgi:peptidoglycan hydrolase-like protein with peptidoglycan-binding domain
MRILAMVSVAILAVALGRPAALAQGDARDSYGPLAAVGAKPEPKVKSEPKVAKPREATAPKTEAARKPVKQTPAETATDGKAGNKAGHKKDARSAKAKAKIAATDKSAVASGAGSPAASPVAAQKLPGLREAYTALPLTERLAIQFNLTWAGDYRGTADGEFSDKLAEAMKDYQKRNKFKVTGLLTPDERATLAAAIAPRQNEAGWRMVEDPVTGARLGIPTMFATKTTPLPSGMRWSSEQGQLQIETFRIDTGATLQAVFEQQRRLPRRQVTSNNLQTDSFAIAGMQGLKKMRVYGYARDGEVRGLTILYDQAMEGSIDPLVGPIAGAYLAFAPGFALAAANEAPRRKVEYGSGIFVSASGDVLTDRRLVEGCSIITLPGLGHAERIAEDRSAGLALLRINGASGFAVAPLAADGDETSDITLIGVADPAAQAGGSDVSTAKARIGGAAGSARALDLAPALGFSGAGAFNAAGRLAGLVQLSPVVTSSAAATAAQAAAVPADAIRRFLGQQGVTGEPSQAKLADAKTTDATTPDTQPADAKAAVTRVICVRN